MGDRLPDEMFTLYSPMQFAFHVHRDHRRKYTGNPYTDHLAEVAGFVAAVAYKPTFGFHPPTAVAVAWLHDCVEDVGVSIPELACRFGDYVAEGVMLLSDLETGNRATRKRLSRERLGQAPGWVQSIKVADLISNTGSIVLHDPAFARVYLAEKVAMLDVLTGADAELQAIARRLVAQ